MADKQLTSEGKKDVQRSNAAQPGSFFQRRMAPSEFFTASPFSLMRRMTEDMDRMFEEFGFGRGHGDRGMWSPAMEIVERDGQYIVHADLPGLKPEEVKVELTDDALVIEGERKSQYEDNQGGVQRSERRYGHFYRTVPLPEGTNPEQVRARFENGVLEVTMPVPEQKSNRRQIPIEGVSQQQPQQKNVA
jgi:HSP20 family protein